MATEEDGGSASSQASVGWRPSFKRGTSLSRRYSLSDFPDLPRPKRKVASTFFGLLRSPESLSRLEWFYLVISIASIIASFVFTILRLIALQNDYRHIREIAYVPKALADDYLSVKADYTFSILFIWTALFALYHVVFGVFCSRKGDMIIYIFSAAIVWAYVSVNYITSVNKSIKLTRLIFSSVVSPIIIGLGIKLAIRYSESNQLVYALVGPDPQLQAMYRWILFHDCVVKFDLQMAGSALILWQQKSFLEGRVDTYEAIMASVGLGLGVTWMTIAYLAVRLERKNLVYAFYALSIVSPVEVIWNIVRLVELRDSVALSLLISTCICGTVAISTRTLSVYTMYRVSKNFNQGIKDMIFKAEVVYASPSTGNNAAGTTELR